MEDLQKEFVPYDKALRLKELDFDEPCVGYYDHQIKELDTISSEVCEKLCKHDTHIKTPTFSQAFRWFREKYDLRIWIESNYGVAKFEYVIATTNPNFIDKQFNDLSAYKTYEKAELACLDKLIQIVETKSE